MNYEERYAEYLALIEPALKAAFGKERGFAFDGLLDAMDYSLTAGGKRVRPVLVLEFARACGGNVEAALPVACAVEMLHCYSLIHDDLPCMDDDDLRRGRPSNHIVYGECTAVLAGDCLQAEAFGSILRSDLPTERRAKCAEILSNAAGVDGICGGQFMDMSWEGRELNEEELTELQARKTGSLLSAACAMGAAAAGASLEKIDLALQYGAALGAAFQIRDDMLDVIATEQELGKNIGSDAAEGKQTFMSLLGEAKCAELIDRLSQRACEVAGSFDDAEFLSELAKRLAVRKN